ncbi:shikimate kinase [Paucilactobacillus kaifaensis]|uniref:shikimate kinase n=1 Tax=Paucilactobacillus kaifaensis TaxID=2559921 RepID=UPI0010F6D510|nr:shikimate kinase [Paucilactobacillus kaifaensis]
MSKLILVGFMGAGKTTVGQELAGRIKTIQYDLDQLIEQQLGESIATYFERNGETVFRSFETRVLQDYLDTPGILSTGGGIVMQAANRSMLGATKATVVYLRTQPQQLLKRLANDMQRPLLKQLNRETFIDLWNYREPLYQEVANIVVDTDNLTPSEIADEIVAKISVSEDE